jgi:DNA-binding protein HU-beta
MNKQQLIDTVAAQTGQSKADTKATIDATFDAIKTSLVTDGEASFVGFGTFKSEHREARTGRNPSTGEPLDIAAKNVVKFKAGSAFTDALNA